MLLEVLSHRDSQWRVGETKAERPARLASDALSDFADCYPETYPGRVISVRSVAAVESGKLPTLRNMTDKDRLCVVLDVDDEQRKALASRARKVVDGRAMPVTFDDRFGAVAVKLRENHTDPEQWERDERARIEKAESDNETATREYETAIEEYRALKETFAREVIDANRLDGEAPAFPEAPTLPLLVDVGVSSFDREAQALARVLAPTVTNTGTGLYAVKVTPTQLDRTQSGPDSGQTITFTVGGLGTADAYIGGYITNVTQGETRAIVSHIDDAAVLEGDVTAWADTDDLDIFDAWSTIQAAFDQLWTDQGGAFFTTPQVISLYDGTYTELVAPNAGLRVDVAFSITISAASGNTSVISTNAGLGGHTWTWSQNTRGHKFFSGFTIKTEVASKDCLLGLRLGGSSFTDMTFDGEGVGRYAWASSMVRATRCHFTGMVSAAVSLDVGSLYEQCVFTSNKVDVSYGLVTLKGCTFENTGITITSSGALAMAVMGFVVLNCTFYNVARAINGAGSNDGIFAEIFNCIFHTCSAFAYDGGTDGSSVFRADNNTFFNCAKIANLDGAEYNDLAAWQAYVSKEGTSPDANSVETDPLLTNPGAGDFSLQAASPAKWAGHGSSVITGINGVDFDPNNPDMGAWSSGDIPIPIIEDPIITAISPNFDGDSFDMTVAQAAGLTVKVYTSPEIPATFTLDAATRFGNGDLTSIGKTAWTTYYVYCVTLDGATTIGVSNIVKVLITDVDTGDVPDASEDDLGVLPGVDLYLRDASHDLAMSERNLVVVEGSELVKQRLSVILQLFKGEWFLDAEAGIPWFQEILEKGVDTAVVDAILREAIIGVAGVNRILTYTSEIDAAARTVTVAFTVDSVYGPIEFEGAPL